MIMYLRYILTLWTSAYSSMDDTVERFWWFIYSSERQSQSLTAAVGSGWARDRYSELT